MRDSPTTKIDDQASPFWGASTSRDSSAAGDRAHIRSGLRFDPGGDLRKERDIRALRGVQGPRRADKQFIVGTVRKDELLKPKETIQEGDVLLGLPSSGMHTNGASLIRQAFNIDENPDVLNERPEGLDGTLGEALLAPHRSYLDAIMPVMSEIRGMSHITGGGFQENLPRVLPDGLAVRLDRGSWEVPALFNVIQAAGRVDEAEMFRVFNMGVGMILVCAPERASSVLAATDGAWELGSVVSQTETSGNRVVIE